MLALACYVGKVYFAVCNLLVRAGVNKLVTFDCHFLNKVGEHKFGELLIENISMGSSLVLFAKQEAFSETGGESRRLGGGTRRLSVLPLR